MKKIFYILLFAIFCTTVNAQSPIYPRYENPQYGDANNAYYKDIYNVHDQYVGTWLYTNGNTSLKITFRKRIMIYHHGHFGNFYTDDLVGEYQYIKNGEFLVNTLDNLNNEYADSWDYNLCSTSLIRNDTYPKCNECLPTEKRLSMHFNEPSRRHILGFVNEFALRRYVDNGVVKLKIWFTCLDSGVYFTQGTYDETDLRSFSLPYGEYILTKQP